MACQPEISTETLSQNNSNKIRSVERNVSFIGELLGLAFLILYFYCMCMGALPACMSVATHTCNAHRIEKRVSEPHELELKMIVNCHVAAEDEP